MERQRKSFDTYIVNIAEKGRFEYINVNQIKLDRIVKEIFKRANLSSSLRAQNSNETDHDSLLSLDAFQSPLLV
jgi:hypothetical protein